MTASPVEPAGSAKASASPSFWKADPDCDGGTGALFRIVPEARGSPPVAIRSGAMGRWEDPVPGGNPRRVLGPGLQDATLANQKDSRHSSSRSLQRPEAAPAISPRGAPSVPIASRAMRHGVIPDSVLLDIENDLPHDDIPEVGQTRLPGGGRGLAGLAAGFPQGWALPPCGAPRTLPLPLLRGDPPPSFLGTAPMGVIPQSSFLRGRNAAQRGRVRTFPRLVHVQGDVSF